MTGMVVLFSIMEKRKPIYSSSSLLLISLRHVPASSSAFFLSSYFRSFTSSLVYNNELRPIITADISSRSFHIVFLL